MAVDNVKFSTTLVAGEDLSASQYHAVALNDGKVANNGEEASGILYNKPEDGEHLTLGTIGEMKYAAGAAIAKGAKITVTTSGWFTTAGSLDAVNGEAKLAVTSGSYGTGLFSFPNAQAPATGIPHEVTALCTLLAGVGYDVADNLVADSGAECTGVAASAVASGATGNIVVAGKVNVLIGPAVVASAGDHLTVTTSGYFTPVASGYYANAIALANIGSNSLGEAVLTFPGYLFA